MSACNLTIIHWFLALVLLPKRCFLVFGLDSGGWHRSQAEKGKSAGILSKDDSDGEAMVFFSFTAASRSPSQAAES